MYDKNGNLTQFTDRRGKVITYQYDALNRLTFAGFGTESTVNYGYDSGNRLTQVVDSIAGTFTRSYDGLDRLTQEQGPEGTLGYAYDAANRRTQMTVSGQSSPTQYSYDDNDRLIAIVQGSSNVSLGYDAVGRRSSLILPNGIVVGYTFDQASELTALTYSVVGTMLGNLTYAYDADGRRVQVGGTWARTSMPNPTTSTAAFNAGNQLTNWNGTAFAYDANGNLANDGTNTYTWNARNHLASIAGGTTASFVYDPFGRRLAKTISGTATDFLYDGANPVQELSGTSVTANLLSGGLDEIFSRSDSTGTFSQLRDGLGSTVALAGLNDNLATTYTYAPYGVTTPGGVSSSNVFQFTGRENDGNGLYYYRARYYNPQLGRFISEDPLGFGGGGANFYPYGGDAPTNFSDPSGMDKNPGFKQRLCSVLPQGRTMGFSGVFSSFLGGVTGGGEILYNYNTGEVSAFAEGGVVGPGWAGWLTGGPSLGFVQNLGDSNSNYSGPFSNVTGGVGPVSLTISATSGGFRGPLSFPSNGVVSASVSFTPLSGLPAPVSGYPSVTYYSNPMALGNFLNGTAPGDSFTDPISAINNLFDDTMFSLRQLCK